MFKNFIRFLFRQNISQDCRATVVRRSCECHEPVAAKFWRIYNAKFLRHSDDSFEKPCEHLATIWRENKTKRHSYECRATFSRMSRDCRAEMRDVFSKLDRNSRICRINVHPMRLQRESCVYIVNLYREIVANYSPTSLQLSHSNEIGAKPIKYHTHKDENRQYIDMNPTFVLFSRCRPRKKDKKITEKSVVILVTLLCFRQHLQITRVIKRVSPSTPRAIMQCTYVSVIKML